MADEQQYNGEEVGLFPGAEFTRCRDERGLSLEQASRDLHMTVRQLKAIEASDFEKLGGKVFARGYIRNYARYLQLEPEHLVKAYDRYTGHQTIESPVKTVGSVSITRTGNGTSLLKIGTWVFVIAVIAVIIWWWRTQYSLDGALPQLSSAPVRVETVDGNTLLLTNGQVSDQSVADANNPSNNGESETPTLKLMRASVIHSDDDDQAGLNAADSTTSSVQSDMSASSDEVTKSSVKLSNKTGATASAADKNMLNIQLSEASWMKISDGNGRQVFSGILSPEQRSFQATPPLHIVIGKASAVKNLTYAGKEVDLGAVSSNNVARITVR